MPSRAREIAEVGCRRKCIARAGLVGRQGLGNRLRRSDGSFSTLRLSKRAACAAGQFSRNFRQAVSRELPRFGEFSCAAPGRAAGC